MKPLMDFTILKHPEQVLDVNLSGVRKVSAFWRWWSERFIRIGGWMGGATETVITYDQTEKTPPWMPPQKKTSGILRPVETSFAPDAGEHLKKLIVGGLHDHGLSKKVTLH